MNFPIRYARLVTCQSPNIPDSSASVKTQRRPRKRALRAARMSPPSSSLGQTLSLPRSASPSQRHREGLSAPTASPVRPLSSRRPLSPPIPVSRHGGRTPCVFRLSAALAAPFWIFSFLSYKKLLTNHTKRGKCGSGNKLRHARAPCSANPHAPDRYRRR